MNHVIISGMTYVPKSLVPSYARDNFTLANPAFLEATKINKRRPDTSKVPEFLSYYRETSSFVGFPNYADQTWFMPPGAEIDDQRSHGREINFEFDAHRLQIERSETHPDLYPEQYEGMRVLTAKKHGILVAPPGSGKTNIGIWILSKMKRSALILCHTNDLAKQWRDRFVMPMKWHTQDKETPWTDLSEDEICLIGGGSTKYEGQAICIATFQTMFLHFQEDVEFNSSFGVCMGDEAHHVPARTFRAVMERVRARHKFGLTATPYRSDGLDRMFLDHLGGVSVRLNIKTLSPEINIIEFCPPIDFNEALVGKNFNIARIVNILESDVYYNECILQLLKKRSITEKRKTLLLLNKKSWCDKIVALMKHQYGFEDIGAAHSGKTSKKKAAALKAQVIVATPKLFGEYVDIPTLEALIVGSPIGTKMDSEWDKPQNPMMEQVVGRLQRYHPDKALPVIDDIWVPHNVSTNRLLKQRISYYKMRRYKISYRRFDP